MKLLKFRKLQLYMLQLYRRDLTKLIKTLTKLTNLNKFEQFV